MQIPPHRDEIQTRLEKIAPSRVPGIQYVVVDAKRELFAYAGGWAAVQPKTPMTLRTTLMGYSMTKPFTALAVMQLAERGQLRLDEELDTYVPDNPYHAHITVRQLLNHTSGIPNPIPLRWVHLANGDSEFDERAALATVLREHPKLAVPPGTRFGYSNIGYWLLGQVVEKATGKPYADVVQTQILEPLGVVQGALGFGISNPAHHANGYLKKWSALNLFKGFLTDSRVWGDYEGNWLRIKRHEVNGHAFGGLVGTARGFSRLLQDQLSDTPILLSAEGQREFQTQETTARGGLIPMTLGWHVRERDGVRYLYKAGGGGGFHGEMRLYPTGGIGTVVMGNDTEFDAGGMLDELDRAFFEN